MTSSMTKNTIDASTATKTISNKYSNYTRLESDLREWSFKNHKFSLDNRYEILDTIGYGAYSNVYIAKDNQTNKLVAVKHIFRAFEHHIYTKRILREIKIQRILKNSNILPILDIPLPQSRKEFNDLCIVTPIMESDLGDIIKSEQSLSDDHISFFIYQILRGLKYMHSAGIVHRDLKPKNLLVNSNCDLAICDFGLSRCI